MWLTLMKRPESKGRSSHEERGLKSVLAVPADTRTRRSSHEERGLKYYISLIMFIRRCRSSHEERGLK